MLILPDIANVAETEPDEIEVAPEMIEAGAESLFEDPFLNLSPGSAQYHAERVLRRALALRLRKAL